MLTSTTLLLLIILCLIVGALLGYLYGQSRAAGRMIPADEVAQSFVRREIHEQVSSEVDQYRDTIREHQNIERTLTADLAVAKSELQQLSERLDQGKAEMQRIQREGLAEFERTAERLLQEKSVRFANQNADQLKNILSPLRERIQGFEHQVERRFLEETKDRVTLRQEIKHLRDLNAQISSEANNLAGALRGNSKTQGDWGEWQLQTLLEASGLQAGIHFDAQTSYRDDNEQIKRPDFIINLPEAKHLVIDSKVSLTAYDRYCAAEHGSPEDRRIHALSHLRSLRQHVLDLASKNYTSLYQINSPDYLLLFVPIEPAYGLALQTDQGIFLEALERNVIIVTPATLLATLRTVNFIWKQDSQKKNVLEIAKQSGLLYDGFVSFTEELQKVGKQLDRAQVTYQGALKKLSTGGKYGSTLIGRAERLRTLGAKTKKRINQQLLEEE
ncbi:DNA recombination protein RmuC [Lewinella sp. 4G2]|uniref:DNA recombination protein RmuC n=1 Tax=Lewinella sp. 4G2 TaxID=1803372 RepID=UPI0007B48237|nr:DNA recombination protein RmuC [Lewinella sp. 4G2]OAV44803.1 recombinase RmuC [Lewinella sp. 4G2]